MVVLEHEINASIFYSISYDVIRPPRARQYSDTLGLLKLAISCVIVIQIRASCHCTGCNDRWRWSTSASPSSDPLVSDTLSYPGNHLRGQYTIMLIGLGNAMQL